MKQTGSGFKKLSTFLNPKRLILTGILLILFLVFVWSISLRFRAEAMGAAVGETMGAGSGKLMGSFEALLDYREAYAEGKEEGLSAVDTTADIVNRMKECGKLEILAAGVKLNDIHSIGDDYMALYLMKGDAVFTIDLGQAEILEREDGLYITIPEPEMELTVNQNNTEKLAEYQRYSFSGSAEEGLQAYLNSMAKIDEKSKESIANYEALIQAARDSAETQVTWLVNSISVSKKEVYVNFFEAEEE